MSLTISENHYWQSFSNMSRMSYTVRFIHTINISTFLTNEKLVFIEPSILWPSLSDIGKFIQKSNNQIRKLWPCFDIHNILHKSKLKESCQIIVQRWHIGKWRVSLKIRLYVKLQQRCSFGTKNITEKESQIEQSWFIVFISSYIAMFEFHSGSETYKSFNV